MLPRQASQQDQSAQTQLPGAALIASAMSQQPIDARPQRAVAAPTSPAIATSADRTGACRQPPS